MSLLRQNKNGDFIFHINFLDTEGKTAEVPKDVTIELSTESGPDSFTAEFKDGGDCSGCKRAGDGLDIFVPLSRHPIGSGRMLVKITVHQSSDGFPSGTQNICTTTTTGVLLWDGNSDGAITIAGNVVIASE